MTALGKYFYRMVTKCGWTLEKVPAYWRPQVIAQLEKDAEEEAAKKAEQEAQNAESTDTEDTTATDGTAEDTTPEDNTDAGEDTTADGEEATE